MKLSHETRRALIASTMILSVLGFAYCALAGVWWVGFLIGLLPSIVFVIVWLFRATFDWIEEGAKLDDLNRHGDRPLRLPRVRCVRGGWHQDRQSGRCSLGGYHPLSSADDIDLTILPKQDRESK